MMHVGGILSTVEGVQYLGEKKNKRRDKSLVASNAKKKIFKSYRKFKIYFLLSKSVF